MPTRPMFPMEFMFTDNGLFYYATFCCDPNDAHYGIGVFKNWLPEEQLGCPIENVPPPGGGATTVSFGTASNPVATTNIVNSHTMHVGFGAGPFPALPVDMAGVKKNGETRFSPHCSETNSIQNVRLVTGQGDHVEDRLFTLRRIDVSSPGKHQILIADSARMLDQSVPGLKTIAITGLKTETDGKTIEMGLALTEEREPVVIVNQFRQS